PAFDQGGSADVGGIGSDRGFSGDLPADLAVGRGGDGELVGGDVHGGGGGCAVERAGEGGAADPGAAHEVRGDGAGRLRGRGDQRPAAPGGGHHGHGGDRGSEAGEGKRGAREDVRVFD